jgi:hypothetical protein
VIAAAILDRLLHHSIYVMLGEILPGRGSRPQAQSGCAGRVVEVAGPVVPAA